MLSNYDLINDKSKIRFIKWVHKINYTISKILIFIKLSIIDIQNLCH